MRAVEVLKHRRRHAAGVLALSQAKSNNGTGEQHDDLYDIDRGIHRIQTLPGAEIAEVDDIAAYDKKESKHDGEHLD